VEWNNVFEEDLQNPTLEVEGPESGEYTVTMTFEQPAPLDLAGDWQAWVATADEEFPGIESVPEGIDVFSKHLCSKYLQVLPFY